jgi:hypothetical protein
MTNPTNKHTEEEFIKKFAKTNGTLGMNILTEYKGVDYKMKYKCSHGEYELLGWQLLKPRKYCCRKGYYESGAMWESRKKSVADWKNELINIFNGIYDFSNLQKVQGKEKLIFGCSIHGEVEQWAASLRKGKGCPMCIKEKEHSRKQIQAKKNFIESRAYLKGRCNISKAETIWLNELNVPQRQYLLETGQTVDGFNKDTNTVYLYHGRYWHGCPDTYDPDELHPSIGIKMKELYKQTLAYEQKIKDAGFKLIVKWS